VYIGLNCRDDTGKNSFTKKYLFVMIGWNDKTGRIPLYGTSEKAAKCKKGFRWMQVTICDENCWYDNFVKNMFCSKNVTTEA